MDNATLYTAEIVQSSVMQFLEKIYSYMVGLPLLTPCDVRVSSREVRSAALHMRRIQFPPFSQPM